MSSQRNDLDELLEEHIGFLKRSSAAFDEGFKDEAKRIAVSLRVLLHNTQMSHSLFHQLVYEDFLIIDTCPDLENQPPGQLFQAGLAVPSLKGYIPRFQVPPKSSEPVWEKRNFWWNAPVIKTSDRTYSRREFVLLLSNKEGGAHVDPKLTDHYEKLKHQGSGISFFEGSGKPQPMTQEEHACLRQISHEILETLDAIRSGEAPKDDGDERPLAFRFPVYLYLQAGKKTPISEVKLATIEAFDILLPVFDSIEKADTAKEVLVGNYERTAIGKDGFVALLKSAVLLRRIRHLALNPDLTSYEVRQVRRIPVMAAIASLEAEYTDEEIEQKLKDGTAKRA